MGNAYLETRRKDELYIIAGADFGKLEGHILVIYEARYGPRTGGRCWHEQFADCSHQEGFVPCKAESDLRMRPSGDAY